MKELKHEIEIIPRIASNISLFNLLHSKIWKKLKEDLIEEEGNKCWICGKEGVKLEAHEFWDFDCENLTHKLKEIHHICIYCHGAKHLTYWMKQRDSKEGWSFGFVIKLKKHFCKINNCSEKDLKEHLNEIKTKKLDLDSKKIELDFGDYNRFISKLRKKAIIEMMREMKERYD